MTAPSEPARIIAIPVSAAWHTGIGIVLALIAVMAFWVHFQLPVGHAYKVTAAIIGFVASCLALAYWLWCTLQRARADLRDAKRAAEEMEARLIVIIDEAAANLSGQAAENRGAIKELRESVDENTGAVEALQDTYIEEGKPPKRRDNQALAA